MFKHINRNILKYILASLLIVLTITLIYFYTPACTISYNNLKIITSITSIIKDIIIAITPIATLYYTNSNQKLNNDKEEKIKMIEYANEEKKFVKAQKKETFSNYINSVNELINKYNKENFKAYKTSYYILLMNISNCNKADENYKEFKRELSSLDSDLCNDDFLKNEIIDADEKWQLELKLKIVCDKFFYIYE